MRVTYPSPVPVGTPVRVGHGPDPHPRRHVPANDAPRPVLPLLGSFVVAYVALSAAFVGLGLLITDAGVTAGIRRWDVSVNRWLVHGHTGTLDTLTAVGSHLAETP